MTWWSSAEPSGFGSSTRDIDSPTVFAESTIQIVPHPSEPTLNSRVPARVSALQGTDAIRSVEPLVMAPLRATMILVPKGGRAAASGPRRLVRHLGQSANWLGPQS